MLRVACRRSLFPVYCKAVCGCFLARWCMLLVVCCVLFLGAFLLFVVWLKLFAACWCVVCHVLFVVGGLSCVGCCCVVVFGACCLQVVVVCYVFVVDCSLIALCVVRCSLRVVG